MCLYICNRYASNINIYVCNMYICILMYTYVYSCVCITSVFLHFGVLCAVWYSTAVLRCGDATTAPCPNLH